MHNNTIHILLADDDEDDRNFFKDAFQEIKITTSVNVVNNGEELMDYLNKGNHVQESSDVFKIIIFCFVPVSATYIFVSFKLFLSILQNIINIFHTDQSECKCKNKASTGSYGKADHPEKV